MKTLNEIAFFDTFEEARDFGASMCKGFPAWRPTETRFGWAVQTRPPDGQYFGRYGAAGGTYDMPTGAAAMIAPTVEMQREYPVLTIDGVAVHFYRAADGLLTVCIYTEDATDPRDDHGAGYGVPRLAVVVNDDRSEIGPDGQWLSEDEADATAAPDVVPRRPVCRLCGETFETRALADECCGGVEHWQNVDEEEAIGYDVTHTTDGTITLRVLNNGHVKSEAIQIIATFRNLPAARVACQALNAKASQ